MKRNAGYFSPNGVRVGFTPKLFEYQRWLLVERRAAELLLYLRPNLDTQQRRYDIISYLQRLITTHCSTCCQVFQVGSVPLKTYLPDGDIDLAAFTNNNCETLINEVRDLLHAQEKILDAQFRVQHVQYIQAEILLDVKSLFLQYLSTNNLTGEVPGEFGNLRALQNLSLSWNQFHGSTIPSTMCSNNASKLVPSSISDCGLHGVIPIELAQCVSLKVLDLANKSLTGSISPFISGNLTNLEEIYLYRNKLNGSFPRKIGRLGKLQSLSLFENQLSGQIPLEIGNCLGNNNLEGKIPSTLGNCQKMMTDLANNQLSGSIPATLGFLRGLDQLMLINVANLTRVNLSRNKFNGSLARLCSSSSFLSFDVTHNEFDGVIPFQLGNSPSLDRLRLSITIDFLLKFQGH
ncbi:LRR receptor-like serine/threonine-protein kinase [Arachis hypogaea]|nr:LRR receptor-like serine/threonine-protein kinase [Arachis hypogaea]